MNEYRSVARQYFRAFEGAERYPIREASFWAAVASVVAFALSVAYYAFVARSPGFLDLVPMLLCEAVALGMLQHIKQKKRTRTLEAVNRQEGTAFASIAECKAHLLCAFLGISRQGFLAVVEEIDKLRTLELRFRSGSEVLRARKWLFVYDPAAKDRLANWTLAFCSALLAVAVAGDSKLDYLAEIAFDPALPALLISAATLLMFLFVGVLGAALGASVCWEVARFWVCRISPSASGSELEINYMCRDLLNLHRRPVRLGRSDKQNTCAQARGLRQ